MSEFNIINIINKAFDYYDKDDKLSSILKNRSDISILRENVELPEITIYNSKTKQKIYSADHQIIGIYDSREHAWQWAWSLTMFEKYEIKLSKSVLNYGLDLPMDEFAGLKTHLVNSRFKIVDTVQIDLYLALFAYLTKNKYITYTEIKSTNDNNFIRWYMVLENIKSF
jgi:hypothetical protein